jgi:hypothetical protein
MKHQTAPSSARNERNEMPKIDRYIVTSIVYDKPTDTIIAKMRPLNEDDEPCPYNDATVKIAFLASGETEHSIIYNAVDTCQPLYEIDVLRAFTARYYAEFVKIRSVSPGAVSPFTFEVAA